jgi:hypothetical protein
MTELLIKPKRSKVKQSAACRRLAEEVLRETAFVLQMTARVKEAILADRARVNQLSDHRP